MRIISSKKTYTVILVLIFLFMLALNILSPYHGDDFAYNFSFATGERIASFADIFPSLASHAHSMNGRLVAHFFVHLFTLFPTVVFDIVNSVVFIALLLLMRTFICAQQPRSKALVTLLIFFGVWVFMPAFGEVDLWFAGSVNYLWAIVFNLIFLLPYYKLFMGGKIIKNPLTGICFVIFAFICGAFQETMSSASFLMALALLLAVRFYEKRKVSVYYVLGVVASFAGLLFMALQPAESVVKSSFISLVSLFRSFWNMMSYFKYLWPLIAIFAVCFTLCVIHHADKKELITAGIFFLGFLCANCVMILAGMYPSRCAAPAATILLIADGMLINRLFSKYKNIIICLFVLLFLITLYCGVAGVADIGFTYAQVKSAEASIAQAHNDGITELQLPTLYGYTKYSEASAMPYPSEFYWLNEYICKYYGVEKITGYDFYSEAFEGLENANLHR